MGERLRVPRILWGSLLMSMVMIGVVLLMVRQGGSVPATPQEPIMLPVLAAIAAMVAVTSFVLPHRMQQQALLGMKLEVREEADPSAVGMYRDSAPKVRVFADPRAAASRSAGIYATGLILRMALSEAVGLFGFVLGMLGFELHYAFAFMGMAFALIAIRFPTETSFVAPLEFAYGAKLHLDK